MLGMLRDAPPVQRGLKVFNNPGGLYNAAAGTLQNVWRNELGTGFDWRTLGAPYTNPTLTPDAQNHKPGLVFNGSSDSLEMDPRALAGAVDGEIFAGMKSTQTPGVANFGLWSLGSDYESEPYSDDNTYFSAGSTVTKLTSAAGATIRAAHIVNIAADATSWNAWINGVNVATAASNTRAWGAHFAVFFLGSAGPVFYWKGVYYFFLMYDLVLTASERAAVTLWLNAKLACY